MTPATDPLQADVDVARAAYQEADAHLHMLASGIWIDGRAAADWLIAVAEEQGAARSVHHMLGNVEGLGPLSDRASDSLVVDLADPLEETLERLLVARDKLDLATAKRDAPKRAEGRAPDLIVNFGGREFVIDNRRGELRSVDNPTERYRLADELVAKDAKEAPPVSLTQQLAKDAGIAPAEPVPPHDKSRIR